ncbi:PilC/PilY family type IV pilus protein [Xanthomonadaceae bacterium JHOS43]|nr:PilC/PilY family type IV pilus protein [Xanthomonadaceae bacterium JHOS43]
MHTPSFSPFTYRNGRKKRPIDMNFFKNPLLLTSFIAALVFMTGVSSPALADAPPVSQEPLSVGVGQAAPPLNMLVMGRDHKLYYEAYNDASDLNGDGIIDVGYKGYLLANQGGIDYYGYFDSYRCYTYAEGSLRFEPGAAAPNKTCPGAGQWSGDFLNYLTTSRMDAVRKVLYGGYRSTDTASLTVLERAYIPQESHSWGKEYTSTAVDGYDIANYAPLTQPFEGRRHLFTNVTLLNNANRGPLLRVLNDTSWRVWDWSGRWSSDTGVSDTNCGVSTSSPCASAGGSRPHPGHPGNRIEFDGIETEYAVADNRFGAAQTNTIDCSSNCNTSGAGTQDNFLTVATASFTTVDHNQAAGSYEFCVDGDDAVDVQISSANGVVLGSAGYYGGHGLGNHCTGNPPAGRSTGAIALARNSTYNIKFRHEEMDGGEGFRLWWRKTGPNRAFDWQVFDRNSNAANNKTTNHARFSVSFYNLRPAQGQSVIKDYVARVVACDQAGAGCKQYPNGNYKPVGILHQYGEEDRMMFGLLTGSYASNTQGGVLRKNMSSFSNEVNAADGTFNSAVNGIVKTINNFRVIGLGSGFTYNIDCGLSSPNRGWVNNRPINNGECLMWGNPIAEMMYETLRYFAGAGSPRTEFNIAANAVDSQAPLSLPLPSWQRPYSSGEGGGNDGNGYLRCATPVMTVISDINPSYDGQLPGSRWDPISGASDPAPVNSLNVSTVVDQIWQLEGGGTKNVFIGESGGGGNNAPTPKSASNFSSLRGLSPEEPSKMGTYYSAAVSRFGATNEIGGDKRLMSYVVALSSPLPTWKFDFGEGQNKRTITVVPFAKSTSGTWGGTIDPNSNFQPTNQIVDYYVEELSENRMVFSINYEDTEQGADHDLDAVTRYTFEKLNDRLRVTLRSTFAAGGIHQYMGYVVSGSTKDGVYIDVKDSDTGTPVSYRLNTPQGRDPGYCDPPVGPRPSDCNNLGLDSVREFLPSAGGAAELLESPLWYAAKYGRPAEHDWDEDNDGTPDNYFLVTNANTLKDQLDKAFAQIIQDTQNSGGVAASGARATVDLMAYVPEYTTTDWTGDLRAHKLDPATGALRPMLWSAKAKLESISNSAITSQVGRKVYYIDATENQRKDFLVGGSGLGVDADVPVKLGIDAVTALAGASTEDWVNYLRGDHRREQANGGPFRNRSSRIGDIFSQPVVLDKASYGYTYLPGDEGSDYEAFVAGKEDRVAVAFVASNDGYLHAFNASDDAANGGRELFAIAPFGVLSNMAQLGSPSYAHRFYVDGSPTQGDAYLGGAWKTVLVGSLGAGGRSVYALDVTDPANGEAGWDVLWEYSEADLGLTMGSPKIARLPNGKWAAIFGGTGYATTNNKAHLYIVDLETGDLIQKIAVNDEGTDDLPNGLATPSVIDLNGDGITDIVYAGDYYGNLWKFDLTASGTTLNVASRKLFTAVDTVSDATANKVRQPITGGVTASIHPVRGQLVFFGTGRYMLEGDNAAPVASDQVQSFYAIWDDNGAAVSRDSLVEQTFISAPGGRGTSSNTVSWGIHKGWYIDLMTGGSGNGERFIGQPTVALGRVFFTSFVSQGDECEPGGTNWINSLWATSGMGGLGNGGASQPLTGSSGPIMSAITIVTGRTGGDEGTGGCAPGDESCVEPGPTDGDGDGENDTDLGLATPRGCIVSVDMLTAVGLNPLLRLSCGRQSWRQLQ